MKDKQKHTFIIVAPDGSHLKVIQAEEVYVEEHYTQLGNNIKDANEDDDFELVAVVPHASGCCVVRAQ